MEVSLVYVKRQPSPNYMFIFNNFLQQFERGGPFFIKRNSV